MAVSDGCKETSVDGQRREGEMFQKGCEDLPSSLHKVPFKFKLFIVIEAGALSLINAHA